jgi:hypothetical protein
VSVPIEIPEEVFERVEALCIALPEVTVREDVSHKPERSTAYSFDIRGKSFCLLVARAGPGGAPKSMIVLRSDPDEGQALLSLGEPYFTTRAGGDRIGIHLTKDTDWEEIREVVTDSYRRLAPKKLVALLD